MKIAIIGASTGQLPLCLKAKELGIETICFAWEKGAVCKPVVDKFYPISVYETERILDVCKQENVQGIVSNASDELVDVVSFLSEGLGIVGNKLSTIKLIKNKYKVRELTSCIDGLKTIQFFKYGKEEIRHFPCVIKPVTGSGKHGVCFVNNCNEIEKAHSYAESATDGEILVEDFIEGREISVESISYKGIHYILQITDKENTGAPHFVEIGHHQPAKLNKMISNKIRVVVPQILDKVGFQNGASHIEMKIDQEDNLYLIEINPRGGGCEISNQLVKLSTGYDYLKGMLDVALDCFEEPMSLDSSYAGIYFLCKQTENRLSFLKNSKDKPWLVQYNISDGVLTEATGNHDRNGFVIYKSDHKIECNEK